MPLFLKILFEGLFAVIFDQFLVQITKGILVIMYIVYKFKMYQHYF